MIGSLTYKMHSSYGPDFLYNVEGLAHLEGPILEIVDFGLESFVYKDAHDLQIVLKDNVKMARAQGAKTLVVYVAFGDNLQAFSESDAEDSVVGIYQALGLEVVYEDVDVAVLVGEDVPCLVNRMGA